MQVAYFEFSLETENSFSLPAYKGSTFRGKFGHVLKRTICVMTHRDCPKCQLRDTCPYPYLFETQNERGQTIPRPFVIEPPLTKKQFFLKGEPLHLRLTLVGKALEYFPYFVYCFVRMGEEGIGQDRGLYKLKSVAALDAAGEKVPVYDTDTQQLRNDFPRVNLDDFKARLLPQVTVQFYTPTYIRWNGGGKGELPFVQLLKAIIRRYRSLRFYHGDGQKERFEINWEAAEQVEIVHQDLEGFRFKRYSNRQKRPIALAGFVGRITYRGNLGQFYPWLKIGELLHVGKNTVFGMGGYRVVG